MKILNSKNPLIYKYYILETRHIPLDNSQEFEMRV